MQCFKKLASFENISNSYLRDQMNTFMISDSKQMIRNKMNKYLLKNKHRFIRPIFKLFSFFVF